MEIFKKNLPLGILVILIVVGFFLRLDGLGDNYSFWTDENHVAIFVRAILEKGQPVLENGYSTGFSQWLWYWVSAVSAKVFGLNEFALRFPSVVFGVLTIWAVWLLGKALFTSEVEGPRFRRGDTSEVVLVVPLVAAAALVAFAKIEILWSRQARPYQALQFFYLLSTWFIYKLVKEEKFHWRYFGGFLLCGILASLIHGLGLVIFLTGFLYLLFFRFSHFRKWLVLGAPLALVSGYIFRKEILTTLADFGTVNNFFYYRVFLAHNYPLLSVLASYGLLMAVIRKEKSWFIILLFLIMQTLIVSFILPKTFLRYFYIVFPFLFLLAVKGIWDIGNLFSFSLCFFPLRECASAHSRSVITALLLVFFILGMGSKLALSPEKIYSLNEDMQEIPEVDWKKIYAFVGDKLDKNPKAVLATNWNDLPIWYLGEGRLGYWLRREEKYSVDPLSGAQVVASLEGFQYLVKEEEKGLVVLDSWDDFLPIGIREYVKNNLKKELGIDRLYPLQPRYWPVAVYSWGMEM